MKKNFVVVVFAVILAIALVSCSSGKPGTINADESNYKITLSADSAPAGSVTFHVTNKATDMSHDFKVVKTDLDAAKLPTDSAGNVDMTKLQVAGGTDILAPSKSADVSINLAAGHYVVFCSVPGHYAQGMYANFTVK